MQCSRCSKIDIRVTALMWNFALNYKLFSLTQQWRAALSPNCETVERLSQADLDYSEGRSVSVLEHTRVKGLVSWDGQTARYLRDQSDGRPELSICSTHRPRCQKSNARSFLWRTLMRIERADNCSCSLDKQTPPHDYSCDSFAGRVWISVSLWMLVCELSEKFSVLCCCFPACPSVK